MLESSTPFADQRVIEDRRSKPTSVVSTLRFGGRRKAFRRRGEDQNRYVDCLSARAFTFALLIIALSTLDAFFTIFHLQDGGAELNPLMKLFIQSGFESFVLMKSFGVAIIACFLAIHENFKISFYGMHLLVGIYSVLLIYHSAGTYLSGCGI